MAPTVLRDLTLHAWNVILAIVSVQLIYVCTRILLGEMSSVECNRCGKPRRSMLLPCPSCGAPALVDTSKTSKKQTGRPLSSFSPDRGHSSSIPRIPNKTARPAGLVGRYGPNLSSKTSTNDNNVVTSSSQESTGNNTASLMASQVNLEQNPSHDTDSNDSFSHAIMIPENDSSGENRSLDLIIPENTIVDADKNIKEDSGDDSQIAGAVTQTLKALTLAAKNAVLVDVPEDLEVDTRPSVKIPATMPKRIHPLSSWSIASGAISVLIVCLVACAIAGIFIIRSGKLSSLLANSTVIPLTPTSVATPAATQPAATPGPASNIITSAITALGASPASNDPTKSYLPQQPATVFQVSHYTYLTYTVRSNDPGTVKVIWYENGIKIKDQSVSVMGSANGLFAINNAYTGQGKAELYWNGTLAQTISFTVVNAASTPAATATATAVPTSSTKTTH